MQLTFENKTIDQLAIELIQAYEPPDGYYLGFSGGKDSVVIYDLAKRSGVKVQAYYNVSPIDPPQVHNFIKQYYPEVKWEIHAKNFWNKHVITHGLPFRMSRWCCQVIKEHGHTNDLKILGMRAAESIKRKNYKCFDKNYMQLLPILNWQDSDIWQYISEHGIPINPLYRQGFTRIGCVLCPFAGKDEIKISLEKFPKIVDCWKSAAIRYYQHRIDKGNPMKQHQSGEEYFNWWIKR